MQAARQRKERWSAGSNEQVKEKKRQVQSAHSRYHEFPKKKILQQNQDEFKTISKILSRAIPQPVVNIRTICGSKQDVEEVKRKAFMSKVRGAMAKSVVEDGDGRRIHKRDSGIEKDDERQTQGDHLNRIKTLKKINNKANYVQSKQYVFPVQKRNVAVGC